MAFGLSMTQRWSVREMAVGAVLGAALVWMVAGDRPSIAAPSEQRDASGGRLAVVRDGVEGTQLLYLVDPAEETLCIYQFEPRKGKLKLAAARHLAADGRLLEFNNEEPHVSDIEKLVHAK